MVQRIHWNFEGLDDDKNHDGRMNQNDYNLF
jgi:hypothetical protein